MRKPNKIKLLKKEEIQTLFDKHNSISAILVELNLSKSCCLYRKQLSKKAIECNCDMTKYNYNRQNNNIYASNYKLYEDDDIFIINSPADPATIRDRYTKIHPKEKCQICNLGTVWNGSYLCLQIDHINGINKDNRLENLRWICPNCHSQTSTFTGRNIGKMVPSVGNDPTSSRL